MSFDTFVNRNHELPMKNKELVRVHAEIACKRNTTMNKFIKAISQGDMQKTIISSEQPKPKLM